jgi:NADP-dependent 3-hydroxy acid dehydrogenase YdfG
MSKVLFITGTSKGFGRIWAEAALAQGHQVVATARDINSLSELTSRYGAAVLRRSPRLKRTSAALMC